MPTAPKIAILYDRGAYQETVEHSPRPAGGAPQGLMGRQVAGKEFLDAYLSFGRWDELTALVSNGKVGSALLDSCKAHPSSRQKPRRLKTVHLSEFQESFCGREPVAQLLHLPCPPDGRFVWARQRAARHQFAVSGVTHTLASLSSVSSLRRLVTAPYAPYDRLFCTSRAVHDMVRAVTECYADHLGAGNRLRIGLETTPLGVNTEKFRPATSDQRLAIRDKWGIAPDEVVVLFVGRLSHHAKAHPFPMYRSLAEAGKRVDQKLHLVLSGWASSTTVMNAFRDGAAQFAPGVRTSFVDGLDPQIRASMWHAADIFTSLSDNLQETFGLVVLEAMASGLPVVASDWNGYRDLVVHGETGFLIPTTMVRDATANATVRLLTSAINYDHFLAECSQTVSVDCPSATDAFSQLIQDQQLRQRLGTAGRQRVVEQFDWRNVIRAYEGLWHEQDLERRSVIKNEQAVPPTLNAPAAYPPPERSFAGYPSTWLDEQQRVLASDDAAARVKSLLAAPLTSHESHRRCDNSQILQAVLSKAAEPCRVSELDIEFANAGVDYGKARATVAWLLKYDLLRVETRPFRPMGLAASGSSISRRPGKLCFVTTCMGRLSFLKQSLPRLASQPSCSCVVVDYSCPQNAGDWVEANFPDVQVVRCPGHEHFHRSLAKNAGVAAAREPWICLIDADILLAAEFAERVIPMLREGECYRSSLLGEGTGGTIICRREDFEKVGGHDPNFEGWGEEDDDVRDALKFSGLREKCYPASLIEHVDHDDEMRLQFHEATDRHTSHMRNRMYRAVKWDLARIQRQPLSPTRCAELYRSVTEQVSAAIESDAGVELSFDIGAMTWAPVQFECRRRISYQLTPRSR